MICKAKYGMRICEETKKAFKFILECGIMYIIENVYAVKSVMYFNPPLKLPPACLVVLSHPGFLLN